MEKIYFDIIQNQGPIPISQLEIVCEYDIDMKILNDMQEEGIIGYYSTILYSAEPECPIIALEEMDEFLKSHEKFINLKGRKFRNWLIENLNYTESKVRTWMFISKVSKYTDMLRNILIDSGDLFINDLCLRREGYEIDEYRIEIFKKIYGSIIITEPVNDEFLNLLISIGLECCYRTCDSCDGRAVYESELGLFCEDHSNLTTCMHDSYFCLECNIWKKVIHDNVIIFRNI